MWISIPTLTPEKMEAAVSERNFELYAIGNEHISLIKSADTPQSTYALKGRLVASKSGWVLLEIPNSLVRGAFDALHEQGIELPGGSKSLKAHVSVMRPEDVKQIGGIHKVTERGHFFSYQLGPVQSVIPQGWEEMGRVWFIRVKSPELERLRRSYGLPSTPHDGEHPFHITIAVRRKKVLQENGIKKSEALDIPYHEQEKDYSCGPAALKMVEDGFGYEKSEEELREATDAHEDNGTPPGNLATAARSDGLEAEVKQNMSIDDVKQAIDEGKAVILNYQLTDDPEKVAARTEGHYAVAFGYDDQHIFIHDPANKETKLAYEQLKKRWKDEEASGEQTNNLGILVWRKRAAADDSFNLVPEEPTDPEFPSEPSHEANTLTEHDETEQPEAVALQGPTLPHAGSKMASYITIGPNRTFYFEKIAEDTVETAAGPEPEALTAQLNAPVKHTLVTGYSGAGKSTLAKLLAQKLNLPIKRIDDDPDFSDFVKTDPDMSARQDPAILAKWKDIKRTAVQRALETQQPHIIEGTQILDAPDLVKEHRRILLDTPEREVIRRRLLRDRMKAITNPDRPADKNPGAPGSMAARNRAAIAKKLIEAMRPRYDEFKNQEGVEVVPSGRLQHWLAQQTKEAKDKIEHVLITGHSGAGKTTIAKRLSESTGLPIYKIDDDKLWRKSRVKDHEERYKPGTKAFDKFNRIRKKLIDHALKLKEPHIIEGSQLLVDSERLSGHKIILVDPPDYQVLLQRLKRDRADGKLDRDGPEARIRKARELIKGLHPNVEGLRNSADVIRISPEMEHEKVGHIHVPDEITIAVDIDGTIEEFKPHRHKDGVFKPIRSDAIEVMKRWKKKGYKIIIWTCRDDIESMKEWFKENEIPYDHINKNPDEPDTTSPKVIASVYVDDKAVDASKKWSVIETEVEAKIKKLHKGGLTGKK